ncbi:MAG: serine hydrolase [Pseudomonadota bacterium]
MHRLLFLLAFLLPVSAMAQTAPTAIVADAALTARANELIGVIAGTGDFQGYFSPGFHAALPKDKWDAVVTQLSGQLGKPLAIDSIKAVSPFSAILRVKFERGIVNAQIAVDPVAPHQVVGLLFTGVELAGDSFDKVVADFKALPGGSGFGVYTLGGPNPKMVAGLNADQAAPLGSAFKLWVLGELARSVTAGERTWADVVPVGAPSLPSGITQSWPPASPVTLQTLATLMISISDNTATDTLVTLEGPKLDGFVAAAGAPGLAPMLTTRQMFAIKSTPNADLAKTWAAAIAPAARRTLLTANAARLATTVVDPSMFAGKPVAIDTLEWFASPLDTAKVLDWLRTKGGTTALAIMAVNPGVDQGTRAKFDYFGFKGGSEPGVITLNFLVKRKDGQWLAVAGNWHRSDAGVDTTNFVLMMTRLLTLVADARLPN